MNLLRATAGPCKKLLAPLVPPLKRLPALAGRAVRWEWDFCLDKLPKRIVSFAEAMEEKGDALRYGKGAHRTLAPGMILHRAGKFARATLESGAASIAIATSALFAAGIAPFMALPLSRRIVPAIAAPVVLVAPPLIASLSIAAAAIAGTLGAALAVPPALCSIGTGFKRRREAFEQEEEEAARQESDKRRAERISLPPLQQELYPWRSDIARAEPHERVEWFEALKEKFPADFAAAAVPSEDEIAPVLRADVTVAKPLRLRGPAPQKRGMWQSFRQQLRL